MEFETVPRFFVLQWIEKYLFQWGFSDAAADLITFLVACGLAVLLLWLLFSNRKRKSTRGEKHETPGY